MYATSFLIAVTLLVQNEPAAAQASSDTVTLPVSIDRVRAALARPEGLHLEPPNIKPDFVVTIDQRVPVERWLPPPDYRAGPPVPGGLYAYEQAQRLGPEISPAPMMGINLLPFIMGIGKGVANARAAAAQAGAHDEVRRAIAEYCAAQPNAGAAIRICMDPTAIR